LRLPSTNDATINPSDHGPTPAASSSATVLGVGQGIQSAFVSHNLIYPIRCPMIGVHFTLLSARHYIDSILKNKDRHTIYHIYEKEPRLHGKKSKAHDPQSFITKTWRMTNDETISLDVIASQIELYETLRNPSQKEYLLDKFLAQHAKNYDYIVIDCPPTPSVLTLSAFAASDFVLIPVRPDYYSTLGLPQFLGTMEDFKEQLVDSHDVRPLGVVFTSVPRVSTPETIASMERVEEALAESKMAVPIFDAKMSCYKVYEKALWQSSPVQKVRGKGTASRTAAKLELGSIADELIAKIAEIEKNKTDE
jgi:chromosome partitioning protein